MVRLGFYAGASTAAAAGCLLKAFHERPNFYSATVYLSQSNACLLILTNLLIVLACSTFYALQRILYGPLRPIEIEQLSEKAWYAVLDTLLAMPSFREDVGGWLLCMFVLLLAGKVWGWIGEGRVDVMEQGQPTSGNVRLAHARLATSLVLSVVFDLAMLDYCVESVMADPRPGMMVIFTFEFAILSIFSTFTLSRYGLSLVQARVEQRQMEEAVEARKSEIRAERAAARQNETADGRPAPASPADEEPIVVDENEVDVPGWEDKRRYLFALEVFTDFIKLVIYIVFFTVSITFNGLPMHIMRDVYMTFASFSKRVSDYVAYRKATSDMNTRYPDATTEQIRGDACIVCRENMVSWEQPAQADAQPAAGQQPAAPAARRDEGLRAKKLPCGHILHLRCLKAWLERQQVCPTCRRPVVQPTETAVPGQVAVPRGAQQPGNPAAPGAPPPQNGRAVRLGRARIFNFGPLRIGFLNGPDNQIPNVLNQLRNPQAAADANPAQQAAAAQQGPNHLGLQVPYHNPPVQPGALHGTGMTGGPRAAVPTQIQMLQLEQRLLQEAHNLGLEQQQLGMLRVMEAELARLRAQHLPAQLPLGTATAAQRQGLQMFPGAQAMFAPPPPPPQQQQEVLQGNAQLAMGVGHEHLPQGMVLPEGWSVMPLQRANALPGVHVQVQPAHAQAQAQATSQTSQPTVTSQSSAPTAQQATAQPAQAHQSSNNGPTDDTGSPLFVPSSSSEAQRTAATPSAPPTEPPRAPPPTHEPPSPPTAGIPRPSQPSGGKTPWAADRAWNFAPSGEAAAATGDRQASNATTARHSNPAERFAAEEPANSSASANSNSSGKGKGRAVEVEDAPEG
ncbi:E3 ubiquitin-protein ligase hrd1 [Teratosphaeriaceae sp. CCFEE 6253]|nr:E3 ubiquitin-protein ligase hrd1 [Teratosphaeriaceae sp. CCFEE 6253]